MYINCRGWKLFHISKKFLRNKVGASRKKLFYFMQKEALRYGFTAFDELLCNEFEGIRLERIHTRIFILH